MTALALDTDLRSRLLDRIVSNPNEVWTPGDFADLGSRAAGLLGGTFTFAVERGICKTNPVRGVKRFRDRKSERFLSAREMAALGLGLAVMEETETIFPLMAGAIRLLLLTGCRKSEVLSLRWSFVDAERGCLRLPVIGALLGHADSKTTSRYAHLTADPLKAAADRIAGTIARAMTGASS